MICLLLELCDIGVALCAYVTIFTLNSCMPLLALCLWNSGWLFVVSNFGESPSTASVLPKLYQVYF